MKRSIDLDQLVHEGQISDSEYQRLNAVSAQSTHQLAFNVLVGFGVIATAAGAGGLIESPITGIIMGAVVMVIGLFMSRSQLSMLFVPSIICLLVGALMLGTNTVLNYQASLTSLLFVCATYAVVAIAARSALMAVLATLMLSACIGARSGYYSATYFLIIQEPLLTVVIFTVLAALLFWLATRLDTQKRVAVAAARTSVFLINFGFWVGSLWGSGPNPSEALFSDTVFSIAWAVALVAAMILAWRRQDQWLLNTCAVFAGIHLYTRWYEWFGNAPGTLLLLGLLTLGIAVALKAANLTLSQPEPMNHPRD